jgi:hypothetical protein
MDVCMLQPVWANSPIYMDRTGRNSLLKNSAQLPYCQALVTVPNRLLGTPKPSKQRDVSIIAFVAFASFRR